MVASDGECSFLSLITKASQVVKVRISCLCCFWFFGWFAWLL